MNKLNEKINVDNAKYFMSLSDDKLKDHLNSSSKLVEGGENPFTNLNNYIKKFKKWLKIAIPQMEKNGFIKTKYKHSKDLVSCGRRYVDGFGVQNLTKEIRGFLCNNYSVDLDIKNCSPTILLHLLKINFPERHFPTLRDYIKKRDEFLVVADTTKLTIINAMFDKQPYKSNNQLFCKLDKELKVIQKLIYNELDLSNYPDVITSHKNSLKQNKEGKFLSCILNLEEDKVIQKVQNHPDFKEHIQSIIFDGFHFDKKEFKEEHIIKLNTITEDMGVKWDTKEFDTSLVRDEGIVIDYEITDTYDDAKVKFEETHFIIENPFMFGRHYTLNGEAKYQFYQKDKFKDLVKPFKYFDEESGKTTEFFSRWLCDKDRKTYKEVKFIPTFDTDQEIFNSFKGFVYDENMDFNLEESEDNEEHQEVMEILMEHLMLLTNNHQESAEYLLFYICHLLQHPEELPKVSIILKSKQGFGKDTLLDLIERLISKTYIMRTAEIDDVFGSYNVGIRDKLVLVLNEMEGKDGFTNKEKIKNLGTEEYTQIREKYISLYQQNNYIRLWILSNNLNPIEISPDDRRLVVFKAHHIKPKSHYFDRLHGMIRNTEKMELLFNIMMKVDITGFDAPLDRPITEAYLSMKDHNINPIYKFLHKCFIHGEYKDYFNDDQCKKLKGKDKFYAVSAELFQSYKLYLIEHSLDHIKPNFKIIKSVLGDIGIKKEKKQISGVRQEYYVIDQEELKEQLSHMNLEEEIETLTDDDFE